MFGPRIIRDHPFSFPWVTQSLSSGFRPTRWPTRPAKLRTWYGRLSPESFAVYQAQTVRPRRIRRGRRISLSVPALSSFGEDARGRMYATSLNGALYRFARR